MERASAEKTELERHGSMTWAQRLKRVFVIEIERCLGCGGRLKVIASIKQPNVIERILAQPGVLNTSLFRIGSKS